MREVGTSRKREVPSHAKRNVNHDSLPAHLSVMGGKGRRKESVMNGEKEGLRGESVPQLLELENKRTQTVLKALIFVL